MRLSRSTVTRNRSARVIVVRIRNLEWVALRRVGSRRDMGTSRSEEIEVPKRGFDDLTRASAGHGTIAVLSGVAVYDFEVFWGCSGGFWCAAITRFQRSRRSASPALS